MGRKKFWGEQENQVILDNVETLHDAEIAEKVTALTGKKVTIQGVRKQRQKLGLLKLAGRGRCQLRPTQTTQVDSVEPSSLVADDVSVESVVVDNEVSGETATGFMFTPGTE